MDKFSLFTENGTALAMSSPEESRFIKMILEQPKDDHGYYLFIDWLSENGQERVAKAIKDIIEHKSQHDDYRIFYAKRENFSKLHVMTKSKVNSWRNSRVIVVPDQGYYHSYVEPGREIYVVDAEVGVKHFNFYYWKNSTNNYMEFASPKEQDYTNQKFQGSREYGKLYFRMLYNISVYELPDNIASCIFWQMMFAWSGKTIKLGLSSAIDKL